MFDSQNDSEETTLFVNIVVMQEIRISYISIILSVSPVHL